MPETRVKPVEEAASIQFQAASKSSQLFCPEAGAASLHHIPQRPSGLQALRRDHTSPVADARQALPSQLASNPNSCHVHSTFTLASCRRMRSASASSSSSMMSSTLEPQSSRVTWNNFRHQPAPVQSCRRYVPIQGVARSIAGRKDIPQKSKPIATNLCNMSTSVGPDQANSLASQKWR